MEEEEKVSLGIPGLNEREKAIKSHSTGFIIILKMFPRIFYKGMQKFNLLFNVKLIRLKSLGAENINNHSKKKV